jgi:hypothetical protein
MGPSLRLLAVAGALCAYAWPCVAFAGDMDLSLSRLRFTSRDGICTGVDPETGFCPDNEGFQRLASELAVAVSPNITSGAATVGPAGFYIGVSTTLTPIDAERRYWQRGTRGTSSAVETSNTAPAGAQVWNRLEVRKGLPFGFEVGAALGQGWDSSMWVFGGQLRWALLEGFHSGLGGFPDVAVRGVLQTSLGSSQLSLQTHAIDLTLSKPFVVAQRFRLTPLLGAQALFVRAQSGRVDLTPDVDAWTVCAPMPPAGDESELICSAESMGSDFENDVVFATLSHTRVRMFLGAEAQTGIVSTGLSFGFDLSTPALDVNQADDGENGGLTRQISFQLSVGLRY